MGTVLLTCAQREMGTWPHAGGTVLGCVMGKGNSPRSVQVASGQGIFLLSFQPVPSNLHTREQ